jgi:hypothetical protein
MLNAETWIQSRIIRAKFVVDEVHRRTLLSKFLRFPIAIYHSAIIASYLGDPEVLL